jgi:peptidoglycan/xylan/chitin deacetylase (PgdA/CDA1 family)
MTPARQNGWKIQGTPVLLYHGLEAAPGARPGKYWVPAMNFRRHLCALRERGQKIVSLQKVWHEGTPDDVVVMTFDDGMASDFEIAFPQMRETGSTADFFVTNNRVGQPGYATWAQLRAMREAGMSIQSHGPAHTPLPLLAPAALRETLKRGKQDIEDNVGAKVEFLSAPFGFLSERVREEVLAAGYLAVCDSRSWPAHIGQNLIHRIAVDRHTSDKDLAALVRGALVPFARRAVRRAMLHVPKQALLRWAPQRLATDLEVRS